MRKTSRDRSRLINITRYMPELTELIDHCPVFENKEDLSVDDFLYKEDRGYALLKINSYNYPSLSPPKNFTKKWFLKNPVKISAVLVTKKFKERRPCLIISHGSGGNTHSEWQVAQKLMDKYDLNVLLLDHYSQRNIEHTIANQFLISIESQMIDVAESRKYLEALEFIDESKIFVAGISRGGTVVDRMRRTRVLDTLGIKKFAAYVCFYPLPHSQEIEPKLVDSPALYLVGDRDDITPLSVLKPYLDRLATFGYKSDLHIAEGGFHAFEYPGNWKLGILNLFYQPTKHYYINQIIHKIAEYIFPRFGVVPMHRMQILNQSCYIHDETGFLPLDKNCNIPKGMDLKSPKKPFSQLIDYVRSNITYGGRIQDSDTQTKIKAYRAFHEFLDKIIEIPDHTKTIDK